MRLQSLLPALLLAVACDSPRVTIHTGTTYQSDGSHVRVRMQEAGRTREAELDLAGERDGVKIYRARIVDSAPVEPALGWVFAYLEPTAALELESGKVVDHPDLALRRALEARLAQDPPDLPVALAGVRDLLRFESRGAVLRRAIERCADQRSVLVDAVAAGPQGPLLARTSAGDEPSGPRSAVLRECIVALAGEPLDARDADRLAAACTLAPVAADQAAALAALAPRATLAAVLAASRSIPVSQERRDLLLACVRREPSTVESADAIAAEAAELPVSAHQAAVLDAVVARASVPVVVAACARVPVSQDRGLVLEACARRAGLTREDADRLAGAAASLPVAAHQGQALRALIGHASPAAIVAAAAHIPVSQTRMELLLALARAASLTQDEGDAVAAAAAELPVAAHQVALLEALLGRAGSAAIAAAAKRIASSHDRAELLQKLLEHDRR